MKNLFKKRNINYNIFSLFIFIIFPFILNAQTYKPPIGIPAPEFGINETVENVYGSSSYYTHYVDNSDANATDTDNPNGSQQIPRMTIPKNLSAGSVVEIHGGPYNGIGGTYTMNGTVDSPVFLRGASDTLRPVISNSVIRLSGKYFIVENLDFYNKSPIRFNSSASYGSLRNSEVHNPIGSTGASNPTVSITGEHMVIYNCEIHDNIRGADIDCHGIQASNYGNRIWILDNEIYNNGGDGIQACHGCEPGPKYLYIGGNEIYNDAENAIDLKYAVDVIISQNKLHNYTHTSQTGIVSPIVIGSDGAPTRVWIMFNEIYNASKGIRIEEINNLWIIGNVIYDITEAGIIPEKKGRVTNIVGNTLYNMQRGISNPWRDDFSFFIVNNIFSNLLYTSISLGSSISEKSEITNNLFWEASGHGEEPVFKDPKFSDVLNRDLSLQASSPAIDAGAAWGSVFYEFYSLYGIDIKKDFIGEIRPQGNEWDIGAYEYATGTFPTEYELTTEVSGLGGSISPGGGLYTENSIVKIKATPIDGYEFNSWAGDLSGTENPEYITMDGDKTISAIFDANAEYTITTEVTGSGDVTLNPPGGTYFIGTAVAARATPETDFQFNGWTGSITNDQNPIEIVVNNNINLKANFVEQDRAFIEYEIASVTASTFENPNVPANTLDNNLSTRWSAEGDQWISYELKEADTVSFVSFSVHLGHQVRLSFEIEVSMDNENWTEVFSGLASGTTLEQEVYDFKDVPARYVRIYGHGNEANNWNSITEVDIYGLSNTVTSLGDNNNNLPQDYSLGFYPNPFNPSTTIEYSLPKSGLVELSVFDMKGRKVTDLINGYRDAGVHRLSWNAKNNEGLQFASGVYLLRLKGEGFSRSGKVMFLK